MFLTNSEAAAVDARVADIEARTGAQIVTALVGKADHYSELPWKAFALGVSLAAFAVVLTNALRPQWASAGATLVDVVTILAVGAASALLAVFFPPYARMFLRGARAEAEVLRHAQALFLQRGLFATRRRTAVLILISLFERRIEILPDTGLHARVSEADWHGVIARMAPLMRQAQPARALTEALAAIEALLVERGFSAEGPVLNELPDQTIEERGV